jgi:site-specific DNA-methyltransferase (adenine-specific)
MFVVKPVAESAGFKFWKPLVWNKVTMGMGYHYRAQYEFILFFEKGKRRLNDLAITDILEAPRIRGGYPAEKPVTLLQTLITQSSDPGFVIGDPFMGSAAVGVAALKLNRRFWGNDLSLAAMQVAQERLERAAHDKDADAATASR